MGQLVRGQMHFWNQFYTVLLEVYGKRDGSDGERFMPRNKFNQPNAASHATGGGQSTNIYAGGIFELEPDEALIVESRVADRAAVHRLPPRQPVGRVARLRQPPEQSQRLPERPRLGRCEASGGRPPRPRRRQLGRHHRPPRRLPDPALGLLHHPAERPVANDLGEERSPSTRSENTSPPTSEKSRPSSAPPPSRSAKTTSGAATATSDGCHRGRKSEVESRKRA